MYLSCSHQRAYGSFFRCYISTESHRGMSLTGETQRIRKETCHSTTLSTAHLAWNEPGTKLGFRVERPTTNHLSFGRALLSVLQFCFPISNTFEIPMKRGVKFVPTIFISTIFHFIYIHFVL
jgi:hypothetical protein